MPEFWRVLRLLSLLTLLWPCPHPCAAETAMRVGVASVDITPDYPIRLNGYGFRRTESEGVTHPIFARALAFGDEKEGPAILITTDNLGVPDEITKTVAARLKDKVGLKLERLAITATHTHTAPMLVNVAPTIFGTNIPAEHWPHIEQYTREFTGKLVEVAEAAVKDLQPAQLSWGIGQANFSINRRTAGGPVDHDLSVLFVRSTNGALRAIYFSYACHCVTFSFNRITGDWAGYAAEAVQKYFPGAMALCSVGCGADSNPNGRGSLTNLAPAISYGQEIADEIKRLAGTDLRAITSPPLTRYDRVDLPLDTPRTKEEWEQRTHSDQYAVAYHARLNLERLARGETLPTSLNYPIQTWLFGDQLALVFLPGETVVDYSLRLKREYDHSRLWVNGYSNDERCYIPSERVLREGGYEGGDAMIYYDRPQRFAPGVEQRIFDVIYKQLPKSFSHGSRTEGVRPLSPAESLRAIHTKPGLQAELVASEPLITSPVAIDWDARGRLWVCEMNDYPAGLDGDWQPGGRVKILEDTDRDGVFDKATIFADNLPFPTGVTAWGKGAFICAAPDILYAEDTDGDGKADHIEKVFSGFFTDNFQARVNSLQLGLDNWIYGANGLLGGVITSGGGARLLSSLLPNRSESSDLSKTAIDIRNRDFRFNPFTAAFETVTGLSQQGRVRDDWGNWFGCNNSELLLSFGLPERYARRNPAVEPPPAARDLTARPDGNRLYPRSRLLERFNDLDNANRTTSACGLAIYRDTLLGDEYYGNAFTCEVVHNLVHREVLTNNHGAIFSGRAPDEQTSEFLASSDNWFRPVQVRTGPDGALYVVDMYRFLIEHPRWIPAARLAKIDVRAGSDMGRIYRIRTKGKALRDVPDLTKLKSAELASALDSPNGAERDRIHAELLLRQDKHAVPELARLAGSAKLPQVRVQALAALSGLAPVTPPLLTQASRDSDPHVRVEALRVCESSLRSGPQDEIAKALIVLTNDVAPEVLRQLALTLGEWKSPRAAEALSTLAAKWTDNNEIRQAVLSGARTHVVQLMDRVAALPRNTAGRSLWIAPLIATAAASDDEKAFARAFSLAAESKDFTACESVFEALERRRLTLTNFFALHRELSHLQPIFHEILASARGAVLEPNMALARRESALALLSHALDSRTDLVLLCELAGREPNDDLRNVAVNAIRHRADGEIAAQLVTLWPHTLVQAKPALISVLLSREVWTSVLLEAIRSGAIQRAEVPPADQQLMLQSRNEKIRRSATELFGSRATNSREEVIAKYKDVPTRQGSPARGAELFAQNCASCHRLGSSGFELGPNLATLRDKDADYFIKNILDPNAVIEPRYVAYQVELKDDRSLSGLIKSETPNSVVIAQPGGITETIKRSDIAQIRASNLSLMPEGLENALSPEGMADLVALLKGGDSPQRGSPEVVLRDAPSVARLILDPAQPDDLRSTTISANPQFAADLIAELTRDINESNQKTRLPWIERIAMAAAKRNDTEQLRRILNTALPRPDGSLAEWQAAVLRDGLFPGLQSRGLSPRDRLAEVIGSDVDLSERWTRALQQTNK